MALDEIELRRVAPDHGGDRVVYRGWRHLAAVLLDPFPLARWCSS